MVHRAEQDLLSAVPANVNTVPSKQAACKCRPPRSLIHRSFKNNQVGWCWILSCGWDEWFLSSLFLHPQVRGCRDYWSQAAISDHCAHFPPKICNQWPFCMWIVFVGHLDCGVQKPAFEKTNPPPQPPNNGANYLPHQHKSLLLVCPNRVPGSRQEIASSGRNLWESSSYIYKSLNCGFLYLKKKKICHQNKNLCASH